MPGVHVARQATRRFTGGLTELRRLDRTTEASAHLLQFPHDQHITAKSGG